MESTTTLGYAEGEVCNRKGCTGHIDTHPSENCSCHIAPPCGSCTAPRNFCDECDWEEVNEPEEPAQPFTYPPELAAMWRPRTPADLDPTKISWINSPHSSCSMIKEGVYPETMTRAEVEAAVQGTFGGRFEYFGGGKFKYIAYTD
jgi:hypothetical protein